MEQLQEQFLSDVFRTMEVKIRSVARGKKLIEERHCGKKVLLVLDDVDEVDQFNSIVRSRDWFGTGSRIIITTRNEDLLQQVGVDEVCITPELNDTEALELFSWHAFGRSDPEHDFVEWSKKIVRYCQGLPLALEVLGGVLIGQKKRQWKHQLEKLLGSLPGDYGKLKSLKTLVLDFCSKLHTYPENMRYLESVTTLGAKISAVGLLSDSSLNGNLRFLGRESLKKGSLLPRSSKGFSLLPFLNLSSSFVSHDHPSIEKWHQLIHRAQRSDLPSSSSSGLPLMPPEHVLTHDFLQDGKVQQVIQELCSHAWGGKFVHGDHMPDKYIYCQEGPSVDVDVPDEIDGLYGLEVCCVYSCDADYVASPYSHPTIQFTKNYTKHENTFKYRALPNSEYHLFKAAFLREEIRMVPGDKLRIEINLGNKIKVKMIGAVFMTLDGLDLEEAMRRTMEDKWDNIYEFITEKVASLRAFCNELKETPHKLFDLNSENEEGHPSSWRRKSLLGTIRPPSEAAHERSFAPPSSTGKLKEKMVNPNSDSSFVLPSIAASGLSKAPTTNSASLPSTASPVKPVPCVNVASGGTISHQPLDFVERVFAADNSTISIPPELLEIGRKKYSLCLVGQFMGAAPKLRLIYTTLNKLWGRQGTISVSAYKDDLFLIQFPNEFALSRALFGGPWHAGGIPLVLRLWSASRQKLDVSAAKIPVWTKLKHVPLELLTREGLSYLASAIGKPLHADQDCSKLFKCNCVNICIEVNFHSL
ncbi:hypothetical protein Tsubulata_021917 [Turnera subulata]|uniref:DUF4283 domain-containing protein n=1 Tax=Turnera subulata TaxID=218843 RepID=A0A9Q0G1S9_9ROSI|nr:hypothetical protein Tsubulata_021917 [Turnera subulata]